jgi:hypothetical protein
VGGKLESGLRIEAILVAIFFEVAFFFVAFLAVVFFGEDFFVVDFFGEDFFVVALVCFLTGFFFALMILFSLKCFLLTSYI